MATKRFHGGKNGDYSDVGNWDNGVIPIAADDVIIRTTRRIIAGLNQSAVALTSFTVEEEGGAGDHDNYLQIATTTFDFRGDPTRSSVIPFLVDLGTTNPCAATIYDTPASASDGLEPLRLIGNSAGLSLRVLDGVVGIGTNVEGETASLSVLYVGAPGLGTPTMVCASGTTCGDVYVEAGALSFHGSVTTSINVTGGTLTLDNTGAITTLNVTNGTAYLDRHGTIATANLLGGTTSWLRTAFGRTVTNCNINAGRSGDSTAVKIPSSLVMSNNYGYLAGARLQLVFEAA